jgi:hypothetical protein
MPDEDEGPDYFEIECDRYDRFVESGEDHSGDEPNPEFDVKDYDEREDEEDGEIDF